MKNHRNSLQALHAGCRCLTSKESSSHCCANADKETRHDRPAAVGLQTAIACLSIACMALMQIMSCRNPVDEAGFSSRAANHRWSSVAENMHREFCLTSVSLLCSNYGKLSRQGCTACSRWLLRGAARSCGPPAIAKCLLHSGASQAVAGCLPELPPEDSPSLKRPLNAFPAIAATRSMIEGTASQGLLRCSPAIFRPKVNDTYREVSKRGEHIRDAATRATAACSEAH